MPTRPPRDLPCAPGFALVGEQRRRPCQLLQHDNLIKDARFVLADLTPLRREIRSQDGCWYDVRLRAYRTGDDKIDGVSGSWQR
jgi:hypothetical protein